MMLTWITDTFYLGQTIIIYLFVIVVTDQIAQLAQRDTLTLLNWTLEKGTLCREAIFDRWTQNSNRDNQMIIFTCWFTVGVCIHTGCCCFHSVAAVWVNALHRIVKRPESTPHMCICWMVIELDHTWFCCFESPADLRPVFHPKVVVPRSKCFQSISSCSYRFNPLGVCGVCPRLQM